MNVVDLPIDEVIPYANNPRINAEAVDPVAQSLSQYGFQQPIVVDKDNVVIIGHTRLAAARSLGMDVVPVIVADSLTKEQCRALRIADNKTAQFSKWDKRKLRNELKEIDLDKFFIGFLDEELEKIQTSSIETAFNAFTKDKGEFNIDDLIYPVEIALNSDEYKVFLRAKEKADIQDDKKFVKYMVDMINSGE